VVGDAVGGDCYRTNQNINFNVIFLFYANYKMVRWQSPPTVSNILVDEVLIFDFLIFYENFRYIPSNTSLRERGITFLFLTSSTRFKSSSS